jgi:hypothetical protein
VVDSGKWTRGAVFSGDVVSLLAYIGHLSMPAAAERLDRELAALRGARRRA